MKSRSSFMAFGGAVVLAGGLIFTANAHAYGSAQWRPAQGYAPTPATAQPYHRPAVHNRQFRPWVAEPMQRVRNDAAHYAMRPTAANRPYVAPRQNYQPGRYYRPPVQTYPSRVATTSYQRDWRYPSTNTMASMWNGGWGQAYPVAQNWGHQGGWYQPPMFARQYGWQPMMQPWVARQSPPSYSYMPRQAGYQPPKYQSQHYQRQMPSADRRFRPSLNSALAANVPAYGSWRPAPVAAHGLPVTSRERYERPMAARHQAAYRPSHQPAAMPSAWAPPAHGMPVSQSSQWRPHAVPVAHYWQSSPPEAAFRPPAYGRSQPLEQRVAEQSWQGSRKDRGLPGWVTTYPDLNESVTCTWCGGS